MTLASWNGAVPARSLFGCAWQRVRQSVDDQLEPEPEFVVQGDWNMVRDDDGRGKCLRIQVAKDSCQARVVWAVGAGLLNRESQNEASQRGVGKGRERPRKYLV